MAILYVASEASELEPFSLSLTGLRKLNWPVDYAFEGILDNTRVMLVANGAGPHLAANAVEVALRAVTVADLSSSKLEAVVSTGYCGALDSSLSVNQIVVANAIHDESNSKILKCEPVQADANFATGLILSQNRVAVTASEKQELRKSGAIAVEMEAAGIFARASRAELPFFCIKVVSDLANESFSFDLNEMRTTEGRFARGKIGVYALTHPKVLPGLFHLKRRSDNAAKALGEFLVSCRIHVESGSNIAE